MHSNGVCIVTTLNIIFTLLEDINELNLTQFSLLAPGLWKYQLGNIIHCIFCSLFQRKFVSSAKYHDFFSYYSVYGESLCQECRMSRFPFGVGINRDWDLGKYTVTYRVSPKKG